MTTMCADTLNLQDSVRNIALLQEKLNKASGWLCGLMLVPHLYTLCRKNSALTKEIRNHFTVNYSNNHAGLCQDFEDLLPTMQRVHSQTEWVSQKLNALGAPMFVQRLALGLEDEWANLLEDLTVAADPEFKALTDELVGLL